jgi:hypothetical protein
MPWIHIWNPRDCVLQLAWRTVAQVRRLRALSPRSQTNGR